MAVGMPAPGRKGALVVRDGVGMTLFQFIFLADLEVQIRVIGVFLQRQLQQQEVAILLAGPLLGLVAVVLADQRAVQHRQAAVGRLLVDPALIVHAARQDAGQPVAGADPGLIVAERAVDTDVEQGGRMGLAQSCQPLATGDDPFVGIQHQMPVGIGMGQRRIAGRCKIVDPVEMEDLCTAFPGDLHGGIGRTGVHHHHPVHPRADAFQATGQTACFVAHDHGEGDGGHAGSSGSDDMDSAVGQGMAFGRTGPLRFGCSGLGLGCGLAATGAEWSGAGSGWHEAS